jgi:hypothetical protein
MPQEHESMGDHLICFLMSSKPLGLTSVFRVKNPLSLSTC